MPQVADHRTPAGKAAAQPQPTAPHLFAHPAEAEFAHFLDFYHIPWRYEPTSFPLAWDGDRVSEMFTPDFYLPEQDLYVELTTMQQRLVTRKHRKVRRLRESYPEVNIRLIYQRDYYELLAKCGYGAIEITSLKPDDVERVLFSPAELQSRVRDLGDQISRDYAGESLVLVGILKGITFFMADLARAITRPLAIDYLAVRDYHGVDGARVSIERDLDLDIRGRHVVLVEDIVNTGLTLDYVLRELRAREPASLRVCALFDKGERRLTPVPLDYVGFAIPNEFVVGYGLDYRELYRNLPFLCVLRPSVYRAEDVAAARPNPVRLLAPTTSPATEVAASSE
jgi:hypoxanthine phosphoribosyltransferase